MKVACLEEIAFRQGFIDRNQIEALAKPLEKSGYGRYLREIGHVEKMGQHGVAAAQPLLV
ncbi:dTDP-glucose pyrophosphorylase [Bradyrhizobium sp. GM6.1]|jgi:glucose-1-phosphate thymidylyltransferase